MHEKDVADIKLENFQHNNTGDAALEIINTASELHPIDAKAERRLVRKIDLRVIPFICITYLVTYIDKATLGYSAVFGLRDDLKLQGTQYSWLGSIFYFGYLIVRICWLACNHGFL